MKYDYLIKRKNSLGISYNLLAFIVFMFVVLIVLIAIHYNTTNRFYLPSYGSEDIITINKVNYFTSHTTSEIVLPCKIPDSEDRTVVVSFVVPQYISDESVLCVYTNYRSLTCFINNIQIYYQGSEDSISEGRIENFIPLSSVCSGQKISIVFGKSMLNMPLYLEEFQIGVRDNIKVMLVKKDLYYFIINIVLFICSVFCSLICFFILIFNKRKEIKNNVYMLLYISGFVISSCIWMLTEMRSSQVFLTDRLFWFTISYLSFKMIFIFAMLLVSLIVKHLKKVPDVLALCYIADMFVSFGLFEFFHIPLSSTIFITHVLLIITLILVLFVLIVNLRKEQSRSMWILLISFSIFIICAAYELIKFNSGDYNYVFFWFCFILASLIAVVASLTRMFDYSHNMIEFQIQKSVNSRMMESFGNIIEFRNRESGHHIQNVVKITMILGETFKNEYPEYQLTSDQIEKIAYSSALKDIGKMGIPDSILYKEGPLTNEEFELIKKHPEQGAAMIGKMSILRTGGYYEYCRDICLFHHEHYDGSGYPKGLTGELIPLSAQLVSVADIFDKLTNKIAYSETYTFETAFNMIMNGECGQFSQKILHCLSKSKGKIMHIKINDLD